MRFINLDIPQDMEEKEEKSLKVNYSGIKLMILQQNLLNLLGPIVTALLQKQ